MASGFWKFLKGIRIKPVTSTAVADKGDMEVTDATGKLNYHNGTSASPVVTEAHASTLTNKTVVVASNTITTAATGNLTATELNAALAELQGSIDTTDAAHTAHLGDAVDAHDASAISFAPVGTIAGTDAQTAIAEVATDAADALTAHESDTSTHGVGTVAGLTEAQTLTNKTLTTPIIAEVITASNGDLKLTPNGTGVVKVESGASKGIDVQTAGALPIGASVGANTITIGAASSSVVIPGNLQIDGTTVSVNAANLEVEDKNITVNLGGNDASSEGAGLTVDRTGTDGSIIYKDASATKFAVGAVGSEVDIVGTSSTQTLTNKTIDGDNNTVQDLPVTALKTDAAAASTFISRDGSGVPISTKAVPAGTVVGTSDTQTLSTKTFSDEVTLAEITTPATPASGFGKIYFKDDKLYQLNDLGTESQVGSGGGGINYAEDNSDAENGVGDWDTYDDGAGADPTDGDGGVSVQALFSASSASPLRGTNSYLFTPNAVDSGEGVSLPFTIDSADKSKVLSISFDYSLSGTIAEGDYRVWIYATDGTTGLIQPTPYKLPSGITGTQYRFQASFQTNSDSTTYRLIIHQAVASTVSLKFDNVFIGPETRVYGAPVTDWQSYTPTGQWNTNTTYTGKWRRVGDQMEVQFLVTLTGAPNAAGFTVNLPSGYSIDTSKIVSTSTESYLQGGGGILDSGTATYPNIAPRYTSTTGVAWVATVANSTPAYVNAGIVTQAVPFTFGNADMIWGNFRVPISGWSSSLEMSSSADTRVVAARYYLSSAQTVNNGTQTVLNLDGKSLDTHNAVTTGAAWKFTAPVPGYYRISGAVFSSGAGGAGWLGAHIYKNGSEIARVEDVSSNTRKSATVSDIVQLNAGDYVDLRCDNGSGSNAAMNTGSILNYVSIERISGPSAIMSSESIYAIYCRSGTGQTIETAGAGEVVNFDTRVSDSHGAVTVGDDASTAWKFTAPAAGLYSVASHVTFDNSAWGVGNQIYCQLRKNGTAFTTDLTDIETTTAQYVTCYMNTDVYLQAGEYLDLFIDLSANGNKTTMNGSYMRMAIKRVGI